MTAASLGLRPQPATAKYAVAQGIFSEMLKPGAAIAAAALHPKQRNEKEDKGAAQETQAGAAARQCLR